MNDAPLFSEEISRILWGIVFATIAGTVLVAVGYRRLREWGVTATNVDGRPTVTAMGAPIVLAGVAAWILAWPFDFVAGIPWAGAMHGALILLMALGGLLDDLFPEVRPVKGFVGHFGALFAKGRLTRGAQKAIIGGIASLCAGWFLARGQWSLAIIDGLIIALSASTLNLLDVRPGRAVKYWCLAVALPLLVPDTLPILLPLVVAVLVYAPIDFGRKAMLGDTGALALGASAGFTWCMILPDTSLGMTVRWIILIGLAITNIYAELGSISKVIRQCPILEYIDNLWTGTPEPRLGGRTR
jgi:hypothetical protein